MIAAALLHKVGQPIHHNRYKFGSLHAHQNLTNALLLVTILGVDAQDLHSPKPYSLGCSSVKKLNSCSSVNVIRRIDLIPLNPYFQGMTSRIGNAILIRNRLAIKASGKECQLITCFFNCDAFYIWPKVPALSLARCLVGS